MIETPPTTAVIKVTDVDAEHPDDPLDYPDEKHPEKTQLLEPELVLVKSKPITARLHTAIKHLQSRAGFASRYRGLQVAIVYHVAHHILMQPLMMATGGAMFSRAFMAIIATVCLCRIKMTWTHIVISDPSPKKWYRRIPERKTFLKIVGPTAIYALATQATILVPEFLFAVFDLPKWVQQPESFAKLTDAEQQAVFVKIFVVCLSGLAVGAFALFPASVALKRVQASMLPEEDETIVPFDRTFNGKVVPEVTGGSGKIGMLDAWKTFDWSARIRLVKLYAKVFAIQTVLTVFFFMSTIWALRCIVGDRIIELKMKELNNQFQDSMAGN